VQHHAASELLRILAVIQRNEPILYVASMDPARALDPVARHRAVVRRAVQCMASGAALAFLTAIYFDRKMGTITATPQPFVYALYLLALSAGGYGVLLWIRGRKLQAQITASDHGAAG
jgi:hypothetical protein